MIVEFVGSTGAGKTTLISEVRHKLAKRVQVATSFECVGAPLGFRHVTHPTAQNLIQELVGLPSFVRSLRRHKAFIVFTLKMMARHGKLTFFTINYLRSLERTIGVYEVIRRRAQDQIILVDEGTIHAAHNVFVYTNALYTPEEITRFTRLVPLPDVIVYVKAPLDTLIKRSLQRPDPPREMRATDRALIEQYIHRAASMFEQLIKAETVQSRAIIVENLQCNDKGYVTVVDYIAESILNCEPAGKGV